MPWTASSLTGQKWGAYCFPAATLIAACPRGARYQNTEIPDRGFLAPTSPPNPNACPFSETTQAALVAYSATRSLRIGFPYRPAKLANWDETRQPHITSQP